MSNRPLQALSRLDRIKRQLLGTNDWAAIGAIRPVKISFTPTEELERFGKRRKLTEADHNRLFSSGSRISRQGPCERTRERAPSEPGSIGNVDIQIYQPRDSPESSSTDYNKSSQESSQPMLLDREEAHSVQQSPSPDGGVYGSSRRPISNQLLLSSQSPSRKSPSLASSDIVLPVDSVSQANDQQYTDRSSPHPYLSSRSPKKLDSCTPSLHYPIPQLIRRFTIDDQIAAELELEAQSSREIWDDHAQLYHSDTAGRYTKSKCSSEKMRNEHGPGCAASGTRSTSSNQFSGWLPEPKHHIQRFVGQNDPQTNISSTVTMLDKVDHEQPTSDAELGLRVNASGSYTSPVRIFGQSVGLDETIEDIRNPQRPVQYTNPRFVPPQCYTTPSPQHARIQEDINPERYMLNRFINKEVDQAFSDRPRRNFQIYGDTTFTPFRQRIFETALSQ